jgi:hypothetical protein
VKKKYSTNETDTADPITLEVYNPAGPFEVTQIHASRLPELNGKTICELSNAIWEDHRTFILIRKLLRERFPDAKFIPFTELPMGSEKIDQQSTVDMVVQKGCEAVIVGNAA